MAQLEIQPTISVGTSAPPTGVGLRPSAQTAEEAGVHQVLENTAHVDTAEIRNENPDSSSSQQFQTGKESAEKILDIVKKDGIDMAFEKLAEGKIGENVEKENDNKGNEEKPEEQLRIPEVQTNEQKNIDAPLSKVEMELITYALILLDELDRHTKDKPEFNKKVQGLRQQARIEPVSVIILAMLLMADVQKEEERKSKQKKKMVETMAKMVQFFLTQMLVPQYAQKEAKKEQEVEVFSSSH